MGAPAQRWPAAAGPGGTVSRRPLVIVGVPRSGTTWTQQMLSCDPSLYVVLEPDSETKAAPAVWAKRRFGRYPVLGPGDDGADYRDLWEWILAGTPRTPRLDVAERVLGVGVKEWPWFMQGRWTPVMRTAGALGSHPKAHRVAELGDHRLLVKSVHAAMAVEWLASEFDVDVLVLLRHPGSVLASWLELNLQDRYARLEDDPSVRAMLDAWGVPMPGPDPLEHAIWLLGVLITSLEETAARHPGWVVRTHEQLCTDPEREFRDLYATLGLTWNDAAEEYLVSSNRPGSGFRVQRVAAEQPDAWKERLSAHQASELQRILTPFPFKTWGAADFVPAVDT